MLIGLSTLVVLSKLHYRILLNLSHLLYIGTVVLMIGVILSGPQINGSISYLVLGPISIDVMELSLYLFIVSAVGLLYRRQNTWKTVLYYFIFLGVVPLFLYAAAHSLSNMVTYAFSYVVLLIFSGCSWRWVAPNTFMFTVTIGFFNLFTERGLNRLEAFLYRYKNPNGAGYTYIQIDEAVRSAGWWGHGFSAISQKLPLIHSDMVFTFMLYSMGWGFGAVILLSVLLFMLQLRKIALSVRDNYGRMLICGLGALFAVKFVWNIGMALGLLPLSAVAFPFISYGGSGLLTQLAAIGIIYSVYRKKDIVRAYNPDNGYI